MIYQEELKVLPSIVSAITAGGIARSGVSSAAALLMMIPPILIFTPLTEKMSSRP